MFTQMTPKKGIKRYGELAISDIYKEYNYLEYMKVMGALEPDSLKRSQKGGQYVK